MSQPVLHTCEQRPRSPATLLQWPLFPLEIRLQVFEVLARDSRRHENGTTPSKPCLARYAAVCREWQAFFECVLYRRLVLKQSCLEAFDKIFRRQKGLTKYIWLRIELGSYSCSDCKDFREAFSKRADSEIVDAAITKLFLILNTWTQHDIALHGGLTLEISIYSPSDSQHTFSGDLHFGPNPFETEGDRRRRLETHDPYHGWHHGQRLDRPSMAAISMIVNGIYPEFTEGLPFITAVTSLVLRRQTRRALNPESLQQILKSLPNLQSINLEPWRGFFRYQGYRKDLYYRNMIMTSLPETLKSLTIFEDFNEDYNIVHCFHYITRHWPYLPELVRTSDPSIGAALAYRSISLERLSASYIVDADDFFEACKPNWMWNNLETLNLTSKLLPLCNPQPFAINKMLLSAGTAALRMPQLRTMVLWNGMKRNACAFRYQVTANSTTLGWCGTWELELDVDVLTVWMEVAQRHTMNELSILMNRSLQKQDIRSHADAIRELNLSEVIHPVSLEQVRRESERYFYK